MSDQDFFFDEEEKPAASEKGAKSGAKAVSKGTATAASASGAVPFFEQSVTMTVATLLAVCALLLGVIVGWAIKPAGVATPVATTGGTAAPTLTEEQLGSGQLPAGHPDISGVQGGSSTGTGTK